MKPSLLVVLFLWGCGGDHTADSSVDAAIDGAGSSLATIVVEANGEPVADVDVVVHNQDGSFRESLAAEADGVITVMEPSSAIVTVIVLNELISIYEVEAGDSLVLDLSSPERIDRGNMSVAIKPPPQNTVSTRVFNGCQELNALNWQTPVSLFLRQSCVNSDKVHALGVAYGPSATILGVAGVKDVPVQGNSGAAISLPDWQTDFADFRFGIDNGSLADISGFYATQMVGSVPFRAPLKSSPSQPFIWQVVPNFADTTEYSFFVSQSQPTPSGAIASKMFYGKRLPTTTTEDVFDLATEQLPVITESFVDNTSIDSFTLSWTSSAPLDSVDGIITRTRYLSAGLEFRWAFVLPAGTTQVTSPVLPAPFASMAPLAASTVDRPYVVAMESTVVSGYSQFKVAAMSLIEGPRLFSSDNQTLRGAVYFPPIF